MAVVLTLATATWFIYILDRLLDLRIYPFDYSERHQFHHRYQYILSVLCVILGIIGMVLCFFLPLSILKAGLVLVLILGIYFFTLNKYLHHDTKQWVKEPVTAIFYVFSVVGMVFLSWPAIWLSAWILAFMFFLLVSQNLLLFSWFEMKQKPGVINTVTYFGESRSKKIILLIGAVNLMLSIFFFGGGTAYVHLAAFTLGFASMFLSFLTAYPDYFLKGEKYRWLGDAVFLFPAWLLLL